MILQKIIFKSFIFGTALSLVCLPAYCQVDSIPVSNQQQFQLTSKALNEERTIWVHLPEGYNGSNETYPVLYLLDGDSHFTYVAEMTEFLADKYRIPKMIVVAILNTDRTRDFTPIHSLVFNGKIDSSRMQTTGGGKQFLQFIQDDLVPWVERSYRTQPYRILAAHSLGGLFALFTKQAAPSLFQSAIMMSPAFYGEYIPILTKFNQFLKDHRQLAGNMFVSIGTEPGTKPGVDSLVHELKRVAPKTFHWHFTTYPDEDHFSVTYKSMYDGIRFIYANWFIDYRDSVHVRSASDVQQHYKKLSGQFGYTIVPAEDFLNDLGYERLRNGRIDQAIEIFRLNIQHHPAAFNAYDSMGEAYMIKGDKQLAIENYKKSLELNPGNENGKAMLKQLMSVSK